MFTIQEDFKMNFKKYLEKDPLLRQNYFHLYIIIKDISMKYAIIPQYELDNLERERKELYTRLPDNVVVSTSTAWRLTHRRWLCFNPRLIINTIILTTVSILLIYGLYLTAQ